MTILRRYQLAIQFVVMSIVVAGLSYARLPEHIPTHWDMSGNVNGWMQKLLGLFALPALSLILTTLGIVLGERWPPLRKSSSLQRVFPVFLATIPAMLLYTTIMIVLIGSGTQISVTAYRYSGIGILLVILGNYLGKLTKNRFIGIRTPWTLASEIVWERTHRMGGVVYVIGGLAVFTTGLMPMVPRFLPLAITLATAMTPVAYSYMVARRIRVGR